LFSLLHGIEPLSGGTEHVGIGGIGGCVGGGGTLQATAGSSGQPGGIVWFPLYDKLIELKTVENGHERGQGSAKKVGVAT